MRRICSDNFRPDRFDFLRVFSPLTSLSCHASKITHYGEFA